MIERGRPAGALHPASVLPAYVDALFRDRRVAILGDCSLGVAEGFLSRGARVVHAYDTDAARALELSKVAQRNQNSARLHVSIWIDDLGVREGAFDVVLVIDLASFTDPREIVRRVKRLVPQDGIALFAAPNAEATNSFYSGASDGHRLGPTSVRRTASTEALHSSVPQQSAPNSKDLSPGLEAPARGKSLNYYDLYEVVSLQFQAVRMIGQAPFVGYALVDFSATDPQVSLDTSLVEHAEAPEWYVAIASERPFEVGEYSVVQIDSRSVVSSADAMSDAVTIPPRPIGRATSLDFELTQVHVPPQVTSLLVEADRLATELRQKKADAAILEQSEAALSMRLAEMEAELLAQKARTQELEQASGDSQVGNERLGRQVEDLGEELRRERERGTRLSCEVDEKGKTIVRSARAEEELRVAKGRLVELERALLEAQDPPTLRSERTALASRVREMEEREGNLVEAIRKQALELEHSHARVAEFEAEIDKYETSLADVSERLDIAISELATAKAESDSSRLDTHQKEIGSLEALLRARGQEVSRIAAELRESDRIARELIRENAALRADQSESPQPAGLMSPTLGAEPARPEPPFEGPPSHVTSPDDVASRDGVRVVASAPSLAAGPSLLEERALPENHPDAIQMMEQFARVEANLSANIWRVSQLERELAARAPNASSRDAEMRDLENALLVAQREIAELRRASGENRVAPAPTRAGSTALAALSPVERPPSAENNSPVDVERP